MDAVSLRDRLTELARIESAPTPVVSVYLDARWADERQIAFPAQAWEAERFWREQERMADIAWRFAARQPPVPPETFEDLLGMSVPTVLKLARSRILPHYRIGDAWFRFKRADVIAHIKKSRVTAAAAR